MRDSLNTTLRPTLSNILSNIIFFDIIHFNIMVLYFSMWFKNGLKAQKLLAQGVWGKLGEVLFLFLLQLTLLNQIIQSQDFGILLFK